MNFEGPQHALEQAVRASHIIEQVSKYFKDTYDCETPAYLLIKQCRCWCGYDKDGRKIIDYPVCPEHRFPVYMAELRDMYMIRDTWDENYRSWLVMVKTAGLTEEDIPYEYWNRNYVIAYERKQMEDVD